MLHCKGNLVTKRTHQHFVWSRLVSPERLNMQVRKTFMLAPRAGWQSVQVRSAHLPTRMQLEGTRGDFVELHGTRGNPMGLNGTQRTVQQHVQADKTLRN